MPRIQIVKGVETDLADVDPRGMAFGTKVRDTETQDLYTLTPSTDPVGPSVIAVKGVTSARWIKDVPSVGGPWLNRNAQYVSPGGNDASDGLGWHTAKLTPAAAIDALALVGGGALHIAASPTNDPARVLWLRSDGLSVPGFKAFPGPLHVIGYGNGNTQFGKKPTANLYSSGDRKLPSIWVVGGSNAPLIFENLAPTGAYCATFLKTWDYKRKADGSISWSNILNWNRSGGQAVVTLAHLPTHAITSATRVGTTVTITFAASPLSSPDCGFTDVTPGSTTAQWIRVTSTDVDFPSADVLVTGGNRTTTLTYTQAGAAVTKANIGTWSSHGLCKYDRMEVVSTSNQVATSAYRILATTVDTVTVADPYSGANYGGASASVSVNNCGTYVIQDRAYANISKMRFSNLQGTTAQFEAQDRTNYGPIIDLGGNNDGRIWFDNMALSGYAPGNGCPDPDRAAWMLFDCGAIGAGGIEIYDSSPAATGIRIYGSKAGSWGIRASNVIADTPIGSGAPPCIDILESTQYADIQVYRCVVADNPGTVPDVRITGAVDVNVCKIEECSNVDAGGYVHDRLWQFQTKSPLVKGQHGPWGGGRLAGDVPHARRAGGLTNARHWNLVKTDGTGWTLFGGAVVTSCPDPFGGNNAKRVAGGTCYVFPDGGTNPHTSSAIVTNIGDIWIWGAFMRKTGGLDSATNLNLWVNSDAGSLVPSVSVRPSFLGDGEWQWVTSLYKTTINGGTIGVRCAFDPAGTCDLYMPFVIQIPAGTLSVNEAYEYAATLKAQPYYLGPGLLGTPPGQKTILHGGFGVDTSIKKTVGVGSGQLTLAGTQTYVPLYAADGTTILTWIRGEDATVNP